MTPQDKINAISVIHHLSINDIRNEDAFNALLLALASLITSTINPEQMETACMGQLETYCTVMMKHKERLR